MIISCPVCGVPFASGDSVQVISSGVIDDPTNRWSLVDLDGQSENIVHSDCYGVVKEHVNPSCPDAPSHGVTRSDIFHEMEA